MKTKKHLPAKLLLLFAFSASPLIAAAQATSSPTLNGELLQYGITLGKAGDVPVTRNYKFKARGMVFHTLAGEGPSLLAELEIVQDISTATAARYIGSRYAVVRDLYDPKAVPYGGAVTHDTECPDDMKPEELSARVLGLPVTVLVANATRRYALGVWDKSDVARKAAFLVLHDEPRRTLFQLLIFTELKGFGGGTVPGLLADIRRTGPAE